MSNQLAMNHDESVQKEGPWTERAVMDGGEAVVDNAAPVAAVEEKSTGLLVLFRKYASFSDLLRYGGALAVSVAMALFLMEGADALTDIERFFTMLGFTGALTAAGFLMSLLLKEQRGSRVFVSLALLAVPVNFTVFGALIYSFVPLDGLAISYPGFAEWRAAGSTEIALAIGAGLAVLAPVVWAGFTVLARSERRWLSAALLLSSAALVVPVRHEIIVAIVALLSAFASWWLLRRYGRGSLALKTVEGRFATSLLFVAPLIVIGRSLYLYESGGALLLMLCGGLYCATRLLLSARSTPGWFTAVATLFAAVTAVGVAWSAGSMMETMIDDEIAIIIAIVSFLTLSVDLTRVSPNTRFASALNVFGVLFSTCLLVALALFEGGTGLIILCIAVLGATAATGYLWGRPLISAIAAAGLAAIAVTYVESLWSMALNTGWWGVAALGVAAIVCGSLVDRIGTTVKPAEG
jgi:hypothetical protein